MKEATYLKRSESGIQEYRIQSKTDIASPSFIPEIKGAEGLNALLNQGEALDNNNPIIVPGYVWGQIRYQNMVEDRQMAIDLLEQGYPFLFYEPVELFRYKRPNRLVSYAFKSQDANRSSFDSALRNGDIVAALNRLDGVFQEFVRANLGKLAEKVTDDGDNIPDEVEEHEWGGKTVDAWKNVVETEELEDYFRHIVNTASTISDTYVIPPVPPLTQSVTRREIDNLISINNMMLLLCNESNDSIIYGLESPEDKITRPYFHIYADRRFIENTYKTNSEFTSRIQGEINSNHYAGICLTLTNVKKATEELDSFVNDIVNIAEQNSIPVICPRSPWKGLYLSDLGVNGFGGMLRNTQEYLEKSGKGEGGPGRALHYSSIPDISSGESMGIHEVYDKIREDGGLSDVAGLPTFEDEFTDLGEDIDDDDLDQAFDTARRWRVEIQKPRWLELAEVAREVRQDRVAGEQEPGKSLLNDMDHEFVTDVEDNS